MSTSTAAAAIDDGTNAIISSPESPPVGEGGGSDATARLASADGLEQDDSNGCAGETVPMTDGAVEKEASPHKTVEEEEVLPDGMVEEAEKTPDAAVEKVAAPDQTVQGEVISEGMGEKTEMTPDDVLALSEDSKRGRKRSIEPEDAKANVLTKVARTDESLGSVVAGHYNNLEEKGLAARNESRILHMRNFNNWIKSYLINKHVEEVRNSLSSGDQRVSVIDLGCGKGGDLLKWSKANIRHLVCVDIAETSVNQCKERFEFNKTKKYGAPRFSAEFIVADCTKVCFQPLLRDPTLKVQMVSCQFAFHYCFESLSQAETMIKNATANLAKGGYFILTIPDANYIMKQLSRCGGSSFGNEVFRIEFPEDRPSEPPLFGDKYQFYLEGVVNCPEFLVHQPTLKRLCSKYGLSCVYQKRFSDVYEEALQDPQCRSLMHRMTALELYPSPNGSQSSSEPREYEPAQDHLKEKAVPSVLTLSASEWDAIRVYTAFAFKKA